MELKLAEQHERIEAYEREFQASPRRYQAKVTLAALLGYAVFFVAFLLNAAALAALAWCHHRFGGHGWIYIGYAVFGFALFSIFKSAFARIPLPPGLEIRRDDFPYLYEVVDSLRAPLKTGRCKIRLLVDWNYNAFAFSRPAFGIFGPATRYLGIGLPLLASLNHEQTSAVIAHEMAHFSRKHCRFSSRLHRLELMWTGLLDRLRNAPVTGFPYRAFVARYARWLSEMSVVIARNAEFEADRVAAAAVDARAVAEGLMRIALRSDLVVERHWREIWQHAYISDEPARQPVTRLFRRLGEAVDQDMAVSEMRWILGTATEVYDSHPSLADRIAALGFEVPSPAKDPAGLLYQWNLLRPESTFKRFIGRQTDVEPSLDGFWRMAHHAEWVSVHTESIPLVRQMTELDREWRANGRLSVEKAWKRAQITAAFYGEKSIVPIAEYVLGLDPDHPHANFTKGCDLLRHFDSLGIVHVEIAVEKDPLTYRENGLAILSDYYRRMGSPGDFREARYQSYSAADETVLAIAERSRKITSRESFLPHDLSDEALADLQESFEEVHAIRRVYLVRRKVKHLPESTCYVLGIVTRWGKQPFSEREGARFGARLLFARHHIPVLLSPGRFLLRWKFSRIDGSLIHRKPLFSRRKRTGKK